MAYTDEQIARFWARVEKTDGCWFFRGAHNEHGYGLLNLRGKMVKAHRFSYEVMCGAIPVGLHVLHSCDTPACVRPDHLFVGTQADNLRDMQQKERGSRVGNRGHQRGENHWMRHKPERIARGERHRSRTHPESIPRGEDHYYRQHPQAVIRGERHANAKVSDADVVEIRTVYAAGGVTQKELAAQYGISTSLVSLIIQGKRR